MSSRVTTNSGLIQRVLAKRSDLHILRKLWHMGTGSLCLYIYFQTGEDAERWGRAVLGVALAGFLVDFLRWRWAWLNEGIIRWMGAFMRASEREGMSGLPFYALGVALALLLFPPKIALLGIFFLVFADPISSLFGILYGKDKILPNKSLQGAMACFFTCYLITLFYGLSYGAGGTSLLSFAILAGVIGALAEMLSAFNIDDNLTIPVVSGVGLSVLNYFLRVL